MCHFLGPGLVIAHGREWRRKRRLIQHGFSPRGLAALAPSMHASLDECLRRFAVAAARGAVDLEREMKAITFSMVAHSMFGARISEDEIQFISDGITRTQSFIVRQIAQPYLAPWFAISGALRRHEALCEQGNAIVLRHIRERRASGNDGNDLLQVLLDATDPDTGEAMTDEQILCESMHLLVAGHETSSTALIWTLYLLQRHPDYLRRAREEFAAVLGDEPLGYHHLPRLKISSRIVEEARR
jgi:cytochrome P450